MAITYFGNNAAQVNIEAAGNSINGHQSGYATPAGTWKLASLGVNAAAASGTVTVRLGIYLSGTLVAQTALLNITSSSYSWIEGTSFYDAALNPISAPSITGSTTYYIYAAFVNDPDCRQGKSSGGLTGRRYKATDLSGGLPSSEPTGFTDITGDSYLIRGGVEPAGVTINGVLCSAWNGVAVSGIN